jgi:hypothetical protein
MEARMEARMEAYKEKPMALRIEELVALPIQIAEQLRKGVELEVDSDFKQESANMKKQVDTVVHLLRKAIRFSSSNSGVLYEKPTKLIMLQLTISLERALGLVNKYKSRRSHNILKRAVTTSITNNSTADFGQVNLWLESSIGDVTWLLDISATGAAREQFAGLPPIACTEPVLGLIWEQVSTLRFGTPQEKADAASTLGDLAEDSERNSKIIIQEGALPLLLRLLNIGTAEGQESAAKALGQLARDRECVDALRKEGDSFVFVRLLEKHAQVSVKVQVGATKHTHTHTHSLHLMLCLTTRESGFHCTQKAVAHDTYGTMTCNMCHYLLSDCNFCVLYAIVNTTYCTL